MEPQQHSSHHQQHHQRSSVSSATAPVGAGPSLPTQQQQQPPPPPPTIKRPVKFVGSDVDGLPLKRRQVQQACESCRKKKKRCPHGTVNTGFSFVHNVGPAHLQQQQQQQQQEPPRPEWSLGLISQPSQQHQQQQQHGNRPSASGTLPLSPEGHNDEASSAALVASQLVELSASRFVGDLSPESVLIEATNSESTKPRLERNRSEVGGWMRDSGRPGGEQPDEIAGTGRGGRAKDSAAAGPITFGGRLDRPSPDSLKPLLAVLPPDKEYQHLCKIYMEQAHPILPIIKQADVLSTRGPAKLSNRQTVFKQAITLAAALEPSASKYLRLDSKGPLLTPEDFHQRLSKAIFASLDSNIFTDRVDHIRILMLMFFYYQPRHASERDLSPLIFSQAVHYAQSLGLHLCEYGKDSGNADAECLFCILWALDRLNASFHGRPCLLHHRDTDRELDECIAKQEQPAFRLLLGVSKMLDRVIHLYRPRNDGVESVEMPIFENMIIEAGAERLPSRLLSTVEIFYHAVSVLSCRVSSASASAPTPSQASPAEITNNPLPDPNINARRSLSADRIVDAVAASLSSTSFAFGPSSSSSPPSISEGGGTGTITVLPFVAYAVALALSVAYQKMRYSRIAMYRLRARARFEEIVSLLQRVGVIYTGARVNAALGVLILREMDKTAKQLVTSSNTTSSNAEKHNRHLAPTPGSSTGGGDGLTPGGGLAPTPGMLPTPQEEETLGSRSLSIDQSSASGAQRQVQQALAGHYAPMGSDGGGRGASHLQQQQMSPFAPSSHRSQQQQQQQSISAHAHHQQASDMERMQHAAMGGDAGGSHHVPQPSWGDLSDVDLFVHFDPGFDLSAVDTALEANLDMGYPQTWIPQWPE